MELRIASFENYKIFQTTLSLGALIFWLESLRQKARSNFILKLTTHLTPIPPYACTSCIQSSTSPKFSFKIPQPSRLHISPTTQTLFRRSREISRQHLTSEKPHPAAPLFFPGGLIAPRPRVGLELFDESRSAAAALSLTSRAGKMGRQEEDEVAGFFFLFAPGRFFPGALYWRRRLRGRGAWVFGVTRGLTCC